MLFCNTDENGEKLNDDIGVLRMMMIKEAYILVKRHIGALPVIVVDKGIMVCPTFCFCPEMKSAEFIALCAFKKLISVTNSLTILGFVDCFGQRFVVILEE